MNAKKLGVGAIANAASLLKSARGKIRRAVPLAALPLALLGPGSRADGGTPTEEDKIAATAHRATAANAWADAVVGNQRLGAPEKVTKIVEALRKELASPAPTLRVEGSGDIASLEVNYSNDIQLWYIVALIQIGDVDAVQAALTNERSQDVRDRLSIAMGRLYITKNDPRQAAVYPRIFQLVQSIEEPAARFPYTQAVFALGNAARYPEFRDQAISLLTAVARKGGAGTSREGEHFAMQSGLAAKDVLRKLGYSMVRDAKRQLQAVPKVAAGATTTTK